MTTVPEPLSADLRTMSLHLLSSLQPCRSRAVKLSRTWVDVTLKRSCSTASRKSVTIRVPVGWRGQAAFGTECVGIGLRRMVMKVFEESHTSAKFIEISSNFSPVNVTWSTTKGETAASDCVSTWVRVTVFKLITALVSSWILWLSRLQYLLVVDFRFRRRLCLRVGEEWLIAVMTWKWLADVVTGECGRLTVYCSRLRERLSWLELLYYYYDVYEQK